MQKVKFKDSKHFFMGGEKPELILPNNKVISEENYETFKAKQKEKAEKEAEFNKQKRDNLMKQYDEQYAEFIKDNSYLEDYSKFSFLKAEVLVRLFRVVETKLTNNVTEGGIYLPEEAQGGITRITSYAKVISVGNVTAELKSSIKPGDMVKLTDHICGTKINPEYLAAVEAKNERGTGVDPSRVPNPDDMPRYVTNLLDWGQYCFRLKVTEFTEGDSLTYLLPQSFIYTKVED